MAPAVAWTHSEQLLGCCPMLLNSPEICGVTTVLMLRPSARVMRSTLDMFWFNNHCSLFGQNKWQHPIQ
jgi:hypothetical protein